MSQPKDVMQTFFQQAAPDGYLQAWTHRLAEPEVSQKTEDMGVLVIRLGAAYMAWRAEACLTLLDMLPLHAVPHRHHPALCGVVALSGQLVPCVSLAHVLRIPVTWDVSQSSLILLGQERQPTAMMVDAVVSYMRLNHQDVFPLPDSMAEHERYASESMVLWQEQPIPLLSDQQVLQDVARCMQA